MILCYPRAEAFGLQLASGPLLGDGCGPKPDRPVSPPDTLLLAVAIAAFFIAAGSGVADAFTGDESFGSVDSPFLDSRFSRCCAQ